MSTFPHLGRSLALLGLLGALTGCAAGTDGNFARVAPDGTAELDRPQSEQEIAAALMSAIFARPADEDSAYATVLDRLIELAIPTALADASPDPCVAPEDPPWVSMSMTGPSGTFGASQNNVTLNADTSYCQNNQGVLNPGSGLFRHFTLHGLEATCNWGDDYTLSSAGVTNLIGNSLNKRLYGSISFEGASQSGSGDCSLVVTGDIGDNDGLRAGGVCSGWSANFSATPGTSCFITVDE